MILLNSVIACSFVFLRNKRVFCFIICFAFILDIFPRTQFFVRLNISPERVFVTSNKFRHFCPTLFCLLRYFLLQYDKKADFHQRPSKLTANLFLLQKVINNVMRIKLTIYTFFLLGHIEDTNIY